MTTSHTTMQALHLPGFIQDLAAFPTTPTALPKPTPGANQVLIRIHAVGCNFFDLLLVQGKYQYRPKGAFTPGSEFSGVVEQLGPQVTHLQVGDRVFGAVQVGAYATHVVADARGVIAVPKTLSMNQAAGIFLTYPTSYAGLVVRANVQPGETVLVHAGAGGVGLAAVQIAKHMLGARVIATASSDDKLEVMRQNGADHVVNYKTEDWVQRVKEITKGKGVDVVYDPVGEIDKSLKVVAWNARLVVVGFAKFPPGGSESITTNRILLKNVSVMGVFWGQYRVAEPAVILRVWKALLQGFAEGKLNPVVFPREFKGLESAKAALECLGGRKSYGKVVVQVVPDGERDGQKAKL
ncbi:zinc-binding dehydrogenase [Catenaria anguillulae PL171]|uniref:Zinc-binding dehydrogenase n=1 Tax=Catenaria anguillulae PL171 TaxID=765915 RepID=A0A1Y2HQH2_9FUNG|nr:zinc-binding dehydrogenase [Catenaria anguillulae PL171]